MSRIAKHHGRIIAIWAVPRSVSTAFEKTFTRVAGVQVVHEPFTDCYYFGPERRSARYGDVANAVKYCRHDALSRIMSPVPGETLIFKELSFQAAHYISDDHLALLTNTFMIRHPDLVVDSLRRLKPDFTEEELGFVPLNEMFERISRIGQQPIVVDGQAFRAEPEVVLRRFCSEVSLPFEVKMLRWTDGKIRRWATHEIQSQGRWHTKLEASNKIEPPDPVVPPPPVGLGEAYARALASYEKVLTHAGVLSGEVVMR